MKETAIIAAVSTNNGIGYQNKIPWSVPEDMKNFKSVTTNTSSSNKMNCVIMGRNTWESLPFKPLKNRINIVISESLELSDSVPNTFVKKDFINALSFANSQDNIEKIFVIGGAKVYNSILEHYSHLINKVYISIIYDKAYISDTFINMDKIYEQFDFDKENIHLTERYMYMIGYNKNNSVIQNIDENPD